MRMMGRLAAAALAALCLVTTSACTGSGDTPSPTQSTPSAAQRLTAAKAKVDAAPSVHLTLASKDVPEGSNGIISADGWGKHPPAFKGTFKVRLAGIEGDAEITSVDGAVYAKLPFVPGTREIDPTSLGLPDPATLFSTDAGLTGLMTKTTSPTVSGQVRAGSEVLTTITGTIPGAAVVDLFGIGDRAGTFDVTYGLTEGDELRQVTLTGPFFGASTSSSYVLTLDQYGQPVTITAP
ncbi:LppX_LprAFG lipoprotein [Humibacillus xanthopallidus]|uniref:LppX_LprAFG lipoprotein n=1 Tax=Humibacillus xanthopallidus TaxID=412689 RepID=UPI00385170D4